MSDDIRTTILIPPGLHGRLKSAAVQHRRSVHAQMIAYIEAGVSLDEDQTGARPGREDLVSEVEQAVLRNPEIMAAIRHAREGDRSGLRCRCSRSWPEEPGPE